MFETQDGTCYQEFRRPAACVSSTHESLSATAHFPPPPSLRSRERLTKSMDTCKLCEELQKTPPGKVITTHAKLEASELSGCNLCSLLRKVSSIVHEQVVWDSPAASGEETYVETRPQRKPGQNVVNIELFRTKPHSRYGFRRHHPREHYCFHLAGIPGSKGNVSPWPWLVENGVYTDQPDIEACAAFIAQRLETCSTEHGSCSEFQDPGFTPTRLVYVGSNVPLDRPQLYETAHHAGTDTTFPRRYIALSHCWGLKSIVKTTQAVRQQFSDTGIIWGQLSKTFQETIALARALGIDYVWIDSLCIIQDSPEDWAHEASLMHRVYRNATLTIGASASTDGTQGLINRRKLRKITHTTSNGQILTVCVRQHCNHNWADNLNGGTYTDNLPLRTRAWCLQEEMLSSRFVHFTPDEIAYRCQAGTNCECWPTFRLPSHPLQESNAWQALMTNYMQRKISFDRDRLAAISSLAQTRPGRHATDYLAGLWRSNLPKDLLWAYYGSSHRTRASNDVVSAPPSWSWASVSGQNLAWLEYNHPVNIQAQVLAAHTHASTSDPTGLVSGGHLTIRGTLLRLEPAWHKETTEWTIANTPVWEIMAQARYPSVLGKDDASKKDAMVCCCTLDDIDLSLPPAIGGSFEIPTSLLVVQRDSGPNGRVFHGLLIQHSSSQTQGKEQVWCRVGLGELRVDEHVEGFPAELMATVTIV